MVRVYLIDKISSVTYGVVACVFWNSNVFLVFFASTCYIVFSHPSVQLSCKIHRVKLPLTIKFFLHIFLQWY